MNKIYSRLAAVSLGAFGLVACAANREVVDYQINLRGQPAVVSVDGDACYLKKRLSEEEQEFHTDGTEREFRVEGMNLVISYNCTNPQTIEAAATSFGDKTLGQRYTHSDSETFFGIEYLTALVTEAEEKRQPVLQFSERDFQKNLSSILHH